MSNFKVDVANGDMLSPIELIIDTRENKLIETLESTRFQKEFGHVNFFVEPLEVGDIVFKIKGKIVCLIERKTFADYAASITDKRLKNQAIRIAKLKLDAQTSDTDPDIEVIYLIEGSSIHKDKKFPNGITRNSIYSSIIHKLLRDHFTIYRTSDVVDTALIIAKLYDEFPKIHGFDCSGKGRVDELEYLRSIKLAKKDNMDPHNAYICQLSCIPGVSITVASVIVKQWGSMSDLIIAYSKIPNREQAEKLLADLMMTTKSGKTRRIGHAISKKVYNYLCPKKKLKVKLKI